MSRGTARTPRTRGKASPVVTTYPWGDHPLPSVVRPTIERVAGGDLRRVELRSYDPATGNCDVLVRNRPRARGVAAALTVLLLALAVLTGTAPRSAVASTPVQVGAIGQIGDSLTWQNGGTGPTATAAAYQADGYTSVKVNGLVGRYVYNATPAPSSADVINSWASVGFNPYDIVIALGTNDTLSSKSIYWSAAVTNLLNKVSTTLPGTHRIWWVNVVGDPSVGFDGAIGTKGNTVAQYDTFLAGKLAGTGVTVLDIDSYAKVGLTDPSYWQFDANHVHMTTAGYQARNAWLAQQMAPYAPAP